ncbi:MAG: NADH dehydrogenase subunit [Haloferacaceae archaeon]
MDVSLRDLDDATPTDIASTIRDAGLAGAGGAGFPTHAKWERLDDVSYLLVNHQESEPNYYMDKWLGRTRADEFAALFDALLGPAVDAVVVGTKASYRERWTGALEAATDATVHRPGDLPIDPDADARVAIAYTDDRYEYGMETVLLRLVADVVVRDGLPMDHGWIVQNTETLYRLYRTLAADEPVTRKYVHVDGSVPRHRMLEVPVGTPASALLAAAGRSADDLGADELLADGGPGWCFAVDGPPAEFGVTKRTNGVLVLDADLVAQNTVGDDRINVLEARDWARDHETEPTTLVPDEVRVPLLTNPAFGSLVAPSEPTVAPGDRVAEGDPIARPGEGGISNTQHASVDGRVTDVTEEYVEISAAAGTGG